MWDDMINVRLCEAVVILHHVHHITTAHAIPFGEGAGGMVRLEVRWKWNGGVAMGGVPKALISPQLSASQMSPKRGKENPMLRFNTASLFFARENWMVWVLLGRFGRHTHSLNPLRRAAWRSGGAGRGGQQHERCGEGPKTGTLFCVRLPRSFHCSDEARYPPSKSGLTTCVYVPGEPPANPPKTVIDNPWKTGRHFHNGDRPNCRSTLTTSQQGFGDVFNGEAYVALPHSALTCVLSPTALDF
ncbi:hypothetical protein QBC36DRAFT_109767 [Triangularia setosa]|uniref:Uncharacterized protein n=1 Tax=Triangularia setosa TaxID=2587417 RepID=A0AAN6WAH1_9PEZI|nr:hypothetical protein QBC36DRAFT_109767 [Podospora setosa]